MASAFAWLDYSEHERKKVLDVLKSLREEDSRDELGIGTIRDAFADMLFPGTSTIQTRARYFLFVPWICMKLERSSVPAATVGERVRRDELALIPVLTSSTDPVGTIGQRAGKNLQRLPSNVYWLGLDRWGIRTFYGSQDQYHRSFDLLGKGIRNGRSNDDGELLDVAFSRSWHTGMPHPPSEFPKGISFQLSYREAEYLRERIMTHASGSLLSFLVDKAKPTEVAFPWEHPQLLDFPASVHEQVVHARHFSEVIHGAALLYNLMLSELAEREDLKQRYWQGLLDWHNSLSLADWPRDRFWQIVLSNGAKVSVATRSFIDTWLDLAQSNSDITDNPLARELIHRRERLLKRSKSRLDNRRKLELWNGAAGTARLSYRWPVAQQIVADILTGVAQEG